MHFSFTEILDYCLFINWDSSNQIIPFTFFRSFQIYCPLDISPLDQGRDVITDGALGFGGEFQIGFHPMLKMY